MTKITMPKIAIGKINFEKAFLFCSCLSCRKAMISAILQMKGFDSYIFRTIIRCDKVRVATNTRHSLYLLKIFLHIKIIHSIIIFCNLDTKSENFVLFNFAHQDEIFMNSKSNHPGRAQRLSWCTSIWIKFKRCGCQVSSIKRLQCLHKC